MSTIVFLDTETTGLSLDDDVWEVAAIRREEDGSESEHHLFIRHDQDKCQRLPESFRADHLKRWDFTESIDPDEAAAYLEPLLGDGRPHIVGAVPNFDTERLALLLRTYGFKPGWHYHLIDVENLAVGYLAAMQRLTAIKCVPDMPWNSDTLSRAVGVEPPTDARHTAMGDVRWAMAIYDRVMAQ